jgi:hypothetical protein
MASPHVISQSLHAETGNLRLIASFTKADLGNCADRAFAAW